MMFYLAVLLLSTTSVQHAAATGSQYGKFNNPPDFDLVTFYAKNPIWHIGDVQRINWTTGLPYYNLTIWQQNLQVSAADQSAPIYIKNQGDAEVGYIDWVVSPLSFSLNHSNVFYFLFQQDKTGPGSEFGVASHYVNFTNQAISSSMTSTMASTTSASTSISATSQAPSSMSASSSTRASDSATLKVAFGVGLGIGIPLVLILGVWVGLVALRRRGPVSHRVSGRSLPPAYEVDGSKHETRIVELEEQRMLQEMRSKQESPVELESQFIGRR